MKTFISFVFSCATLFQVNAFASLPPHLKDPLCLAFSAKYLPDLAIALRSRSRTTQRNAFSTLIQILSLLPAPETDPYFRRFLQSPQSTGLPTLVASAFVDGIAWLRPSGPGPLCDLVYHMLTWCAVAQGDDAEAPVDRGVRDALRARIADLQADADYGALPREQRAQIARLAETLKRIHFMPAGGLPASAYLNSVRELCEGQIPGVEECVVCMDDEQLFLCSKCRTVKYCSKECQLKAWKDGHKVRCFTTAY